MDSKAVISVTEDGVLVTANVEPGLPPDTQHESQSQKITGLSQTQLQEPRPIRCAAIRQALTHFEQAAHSSYAVPQPDCQSDHVDSSDEEDSTTRTEQGSWIPPRPLFSRPRRSSRERINAALLDMSPVEPRGPCIFSRGHLYPTEYEQHAPASSSTEARRDSEAGEAPGAPALSSQAPQTPPPEPERTPTPPYHYDSEFGPDWEPEEEERSDDEGETESDSESYLDEGEGFTLQPVELNNVKAFDDDVKRFYRKDPLAGGSTVHKKAPSRIVPIPSPKPAFTEEELLELGGMPTVRLVPKSAIPTEPEEPLPFHGPDGVLLSRFASLNMKGDDDYGI